jgi:hypothetical protein
LTPDLIARGWKLIARAPDRLFAVSESWGCTGIKPDMRLVIIEAYELMEFIEYVKGKANSI